MSLTTRCPNCQTLFKVVPDQLRIASGWVRCGYCRQVFDGRAQARSDTEVAAATEPSANKLTQASELTAASPPIAPGSPTPNLTAFVYESAPDAIAPDPSLTDLTTFGDMSVEVLADTAWPLDTAPPEPESESESGPKPDRGLEAHPAPDSITDAQSVLADIGTIRPALEVLHAFDPEPTLESQVDFELTLGLPLTTQHGDDRAELPSTRRTLMHEEATPSFVLRDRRRAVWRSRPIRAMLWLALLLLLTGLAVQLALQQRDWLAARHPELAPTLTALCKPLGCQIEPYRELTAVIIDGSNFNRRDADTFGFSVNLRNRANLPIATPSIELTLTDINGSILVRRVLTPEQLAAPAILPQRGEFNGGGALRIAADARPDAIVNYRLVAFYP